MKPDEMLENYKRTGNISGGKNKSPLRVLVAVFLAKLSVVLFIAFLLYLSVPVFGVEASYFELIPLAILIFVVM